MNPSRLIFLIVAGCCLLRPESLMAQAGGSSYIPDKQYSADQIITTKEGQSISSKVYMDNGKIRSEMNRAGMSVVSIIRPDQKKIYSVMPAQKMVMAMSFDPEKLKQKVPTSTDDCKFEAVGPDTVDGAACTKYKMTNSQNSKVCFWWVNVATKAPVKITAEDGSFTMLLKNYQAGPQDAALFEVPADYKVMTMPGGAGQ